MKEIDLSSRESRPLWDPPRLIFMGKSKGVLRQAEVAQGVLGRLRPRIFLTFRHYKGARSSAKHTGRLYLRENPWYSLSEAEPTPGHVVLSGVPGKKSPVTPPGIDPGTVRLVARHLNHYATPGPPNSWVLWCFRGGKMARDILLLLGCAFIT